MSVSFSLCQVRDSYLRTAKWAQSQIKAQSYSQDKFCSEETSPGDRDNLSDNAPGTKQDTNRDGFPAANLVGDLAANEAPEELTNGTDVVEGCLPLGRENVFAIELVAEVAAEG